MKKINMFCFPFAGGSGYSYNSFTKVLPEDINIVTIEYPGRGARIKELLLTNMDALVEDALTQLESELETPYVIYGHSMGTVVGYLITKKILKDRLNPPLALFFTGSAAPSARSSEPLIHQMPKEEFNQHLKDLGGSLDEVLMSSELMEFYDPILRADFEAVELYEYQESTPFDIPIYIITGIDEDITHEKALLWKQETTADFEFSQLFGKHFFIFDHEKTLISYIKRKVTKLSKKI